MDKSKPVIWVRDSFKRRGTWDSPSFKSRGTRFCPAKP